MNRKKINKKKKRSRNTGSLAFSLFGIMILTAGVLFVYIFDLGVLPVKYLTVFGAVIGGGALINVLLLLFAKKRRKPKLNTVSGILSTMFVIAAVFGLFFLKNLYGSLEEIADDKEYITVNLYVKADSQYTDINELSPSQKLGIRSIIDIENTQSALEDLREKIGFKFDEKEYVDFTSQVEALLNDEVDFILLNDGFLDMVSEIWPDFEYRTKVIYAHKIEIDPEQIKKSDIKVTEEPFCILVSGLDSRGRGEIRNSGNSDVNIVIAVNPETKKILMINIPRDFYVPLNGSSSKMDKLTHAGNYGVESSVKTIESLLGLEIQYYVKVNFYSVVNIVDALGGITVNSEHSFRSLAGINERTYYSFKKGENKLNGDQALAFSRERSSFSAGDRTRGKNQMAVIKAVMDKIVSPAIITSFSGVLKSITSNTKTNFSIEEINALIQMQLTDMASWEIKTISVNGSGASRATYSYGSEKLSVIVPDKKTITAAKNELNRVLVKTDEKENIFRRSGKYAQYMTEEEEE